MFFCQNSQKQNMVLLKPNQRFLASLVSFISNKDGYGLTVTETKDFMSSLAENNDIELYNKDVKILIWTTIVIILSSALVIES